MNLFWCNGCGEPLYKCYCDNICPHGCGKLERNCIADSVDGYCPNDPNQPRYEVVITSKNVIELKATWQ